MNIKFHYSRLLIDSRSFFISAVFGLVCDLVVYTTLVLLTVPAGPSNFVSSGLSILLVYLILTKNIFRGGTGPKKFFYFVSWYLISISTTSIFIDFLNSELGFNKLLCKIVVIPISFLANFLVVRRILSSPGDRVGS